MARVIEVELNVDNKEAVKSVNDLEQELEQLREEFGQVEIGSKEFTKLGNEIKKTEGKLKDIELQFEALDKEQRIAATTQAFTGLVGVVEIGAGAFAAFGAESEALEEIQGRVVGLVGVVQGLQAAQEGVIAVTKLVGPAFAAAGKGIRTALAATGIGLLVAGVGTLIAYWDDLNELISGTPGEKRLKALREELEIGKEQLRNLDRRLEKELELSRTTIATRGSLESYITDIGAEINKLEQQLNEGIADPELVKEVEDQIDALYQKRKDAQKLYREDLLKAVDDQYAAELIRLEVQGKDTRALELKIAKQKLEQIKKFADAEGEEAKQLELQILRITTEFQTERTKKNKEESDKRQAKAEEEAGITRSYEDIKAKGLEKTTTAEEDYTKKMVDLTDIRIKATEMEAGKAEEIRKLRKKERQEELAADTQLFTEQVTNYANTARNLTGTLNDFYTQNYDTQLNLLENQFNQGLITEEEFNKKSEELSKESFERNKNLSIANTLISTFQGATEAFANSFKIDPTGITGGILAGVVTALGLAQVNAISQTSYSNPTPTIGSTPTISGGSAGAPGGLFSDRITLGQDSVTTSTGGPGAIKTYVLAGDVANGLEANQQIKRRRKL